MLNKLSKNKPLMIIISLCVLTVLLFLSFFIFAPYFTNVNTHADSIFYLNDKIGNVMKLSAASLGASSGISLLPGDAGTPIATQLATFSNYFLIILGGLYLEKYLLIILSYLVFYILMPVASLFLAFYIWTLNKSALKLFLKVAVFSALVFFTIPTSVAISQIIDSTYEVSVNELVEDSSEIAEDSQEVEQQSGDFFSQIVGVISDGYDAVTGGISSVIDDAENWVTKVIESIAVMIVTSCVIPILVFLCLFNGTKFIFKLDFDIPMNKFIENKKVLKIENKEENSLK